MDWPSGRRRRRRQRQLRGGSSAHTCWLCHDLHAVPPIQCKQRQRTQECAVAASLGGQLERQAGGLAHLELSKGRLDRRVRATAAVLTQAC